MSESRAKNDISEQPSKHRPQGPDRCGRERGPSQTVAPATSAQVRALTQGEARGTRALQPQAWERPVFLKGGDSHNLTTLGDDSRRW